jgi:hypothetical protein
MTEANPIDDFIAAVEDLRGTDTSVRTTAHTSSVSADGWPTSVPATDAPVDNT